MYIYIICPVRHATEVWQQATLTYASELEKQGHNVYLPFRDANQKDNTGKKICEAHAMAVFNCDEIHIAYDGESEGWLFDLGMAFVLNKTIKIIEHLFPTKTKGKSYPNMVYQWQKEQAEKKWRGVHDIYNVV